MVNVIIVKVDDDFKNSLSEQNDNYFFRVKFRCPFVVVRMLIVNRPYC